MVNRTATLQLSLVDTRAEIVVFAARLPQELVNPLRKEMAFVQLAQLSATHANSAFHICLNFSGRRSMQEANLARDSIGPEKSACDRRLCAAAE
jgi:hypothetical protein